MRNAHTYYSRIDRRVTVFLLMKKMKAETFQLHVQKSNDRPNMVVLFQNTVFVGIFRAVCFLTLSDILASCPRPMTSINPPSLFSANGTLTTSWTLESATVAIPNGNGLEVRSRLFNGQIPGETLRLKPGDTLSINFQNLLEDNGLGYVHNAYSAADETNLHFHGLHVSGKLFCH